MIGRYGPLFFLAGDTFPQDAYIETALRARIGDRFESWTGQAEILGRTGGAAGWGDHAKRLAGFERMVADMPGMTHAVLVGRSSGARVATLYALRRRVAAVVCIGYPFRRPGQEPEPERYEHLACLAVPTLILQGLNDAYGALDVLDGYAFSERVTLRFVNTNHQFPLQAHGWDQVARTILGFCGSAIGVPDLPACDPC